MGLSDKISDKFKEAVDSMKDQGWYQQLQSSFQQLNPEQQTYVRWGSIAASILVLFYFIYSAASSANAVKEEYFEKQELLTLVNQAGDEIRRLKGQNSTLASGTAQNWKTVLQNLASAQGLQPDALEVTKESPGTSQTMIQETLVEATLKGILIRPLVQFLYSVEHNSPPMKLKGLQVETGNDGLLNIKLVVSGYMPKADKK